MQNNGTDWKLQSGALQEDQTVDVAAVTSVCQTATDETVRGRKDGQAGEKESYLKNTVNTWSVFMGRLTIVLPTE